MAITKKKHNKKRRIIYTAVAALCGVFLMSAVLFYSKSSHTAFFIQPWICPNCSLDPPVPCAPIGTANTVALELIQNLYDYLSDAAEDLEQHISDEVDDMVESLLDEIDDMEMDIIDWWETWYYYDFRPMLTEMTKQLNTRESDTARSFGSFVDSQEQAMTQMEYQDLEKGAARDHKTHDNTCVALTQAGGMGRTNSFVQGMQNAWENRSSDRGMRAVGSVDAAGETAVHNRRWQDYVAHFCDPADNSGNAACTVPGGAPNADIKAGNTLFAAKTVDIRQDEYERGVDALIENMVGPDMYDAISPSALGSIQGRAAMINRRSFVARKNVSRSVPQLISSWRVPGSDMGDYLTSVREHAGIDTVNISDSPSYKEIMHAMTVERFMGENQYGLSLVGATPLNIAREKVILKTFYLMQLRDYYELLERMALTLSVQVAVLLDTTSPKQNYATISNK